MKTIDFVVLYVDGSDLVWREKMLRYRGGNRRMSRRYGTAITVSSVTGSAPSPKMRLGFTKSMS